MHKMILKQMEKIEKIKIALNKTTSPYLKRDLTKQLFREQKQLSLALKNIYGEE